MVNASPPGSIVRDLAPSGVRSLVSKNICPVKISLALTPVPKFGSKNPVLGVISILNPTVAAFAGTGVIVIKKHAKKADKRHDVILFMITFSI
jgi:hypothetical protein